MNYVLMARKKDKLPIFSSSIRSTDSQNQLFLPTNYSQKPVEQDPETSHKRAMATMQFSQHLMALKMVRRCKAPTEINLHL
jgi:hypothetical protein